MLRVSPCQKGTENTRFTVSACCRMRAARPPPRYPIGIFSGIFTASAAHFTANGNWPAKSGITTAALRRRCVTPTKPNSNSTTSNRTSGKKTISRPSIRKSTPTSRSVILTGCGSSRDDVCRYTRLPENPLGSCDRQRVDENSEKRRSYERERVEYDAVAAPLRPLGHAPRDDGLQDS